MLSSLIALIVLPFLLAGDPPAIDHEAVAKRLVGELRSYGVPIDAESPGIEVRPPEECRKDIDRQQDLFFPAGYFEGIRLVGKAIGLPSPGSAERLRRMAVEEMTKSLIAYYQFDRDALIFVESALGNLMKAVGLEHLVAHELVHAWQDQTVGLEALLRNGPRTAEAARITSTLIEGQAELIALDLALSKAGKDLTSIDLEHVSTDLERLFAGEGRSLPYKIGREYALRKAKAGGREALLGLLGDRPASTEQLIHPEKLGVDVPVEVTLPAWTEEKRKAEVVHEDVIGEMDLYSLLLEAGRDRLVAWIAAAGWDGSRLRVVRREGEVGLVWRTVWDREVDAEQFEAALHPIDTQVVRHGRVVDAVGSTDPDLRAALAAELAAHPFTTPADEADAKSTAAAEARRREEIGDEAVVEGERWVLPDRGISLPVPEGWTEREVRGMKLLTGTVAGGFADNINVIELPNAFGTDLDILLEMNRKQLDMIPALKLDAAGKTTVDGRPALLLEYHGQIAPPQPALHFLAILHASERFQIVVTASVLETRWKDKEAEVRKALSGVRFLE